MRNVGISWFLILVACIIFAVGAIVTGDDGPISFRNHPLVVESGLAVYLLALLVGGWFAAPA